MIVRTLTVVTLLLAAAVPPGRAQSGAPAPDPVDCGVHVTRVCLYAAALDEAAAHDDPFMRGYLLSNWIAKLSAAPSAEDAVATAYAARAVELMDDSIPRDRDIARLAILQARSGMFEDAVATLARLSKDFVPLEARTVLAIRLDRAGRNDDAERQFEFVRAAVVSAFTLHQAYDTFRELAPLLDEARGTPTADRLFDTLFQVTTREREMYIPVGDLARLGRLAAEAGMWAAAHRAFDAARPAVDTARTVWERSSVVDAVIKEQLAIGWLADALAWVDLLESSAARARQLWAIAGAEAASGLPPRATLVRAMTETARMRDVDGRQSQLIEIGAAMANANLHDLASAAFAHARLASTATEYVSRSDRLLNLARTLRDIGYRDFAADVLGDALVEVQGSTSRYFRNRDLGAIAIQFGKIGRPAEALRVLREVADPTEYVLACLDIAGAAAVADRMDESAAWTARADALLHDPVPDRIQLAHLAVLVDQARAHRRASRFGEMQALLQTIAEQVADLDGDRDSILMAMAEIYGDAGMVGPALTAIADLDDAHNLRKALLDLAMASLRDGQSADVWLIVETVRKAPDLHVSFRLDFLLELSTMLP